MSSSPFENQAWYVWAEHLVVILGAGYVLKNLLKGGLVNNLTRLTIEAASVLPGTKQILEQQQSEAVSAIGEMIFDEEYEDENVMEEIPDEGLPAEKVLEILESWRAKESGYRTGKAFGGIYTDYKGIEEVERKALDLYSDSNGLYPTTFPGLRKIEAEVVRMACNLLHGDAESCGTMTSGGTESILCAMKTYRDRGHKMFGITAPEVLIPESAHAAFIKGAHYFGMKLVSIPVGDDWRVDVNEIKKAMTKNTVMVVAGAPSFPHGVIDPIEEIGAYILNHPQAGLHIDACLGGFILPWLQQLGHVTKKYDFECPGVTSISADLHKYGFAPKGASVILYKNRDYRKFQYFAYCDWSGGLYCSPAVQGSRAGGPMAGAWAVFVHMGKKGFHETATHYYNAFSTILEGVRSIPELQTVGTPDACTIAFNSTTIDIYMVADAMAARGWVVNRLQRPRCVQVQVGARKNFDADAYVQALRESATEVRENPEKFVGGMAGIYGLAATLADAHSVAPLKDILAGYMDCCYMTKPSKK